jgi:hypothetical protein
MAETYTSGTWIVKPGEEDAFVDEWTAFVTWASDMPGSGTRFVWFATWISRTPT